MGLSSENFGKQLEKTSDEIQTEQWNNLINEQDKFIKWKDYCIHQKKC